MEPTKKILSIDDSTTMRMMLRKTVEELGFLFIEATDGAKGLQVLEREAENISLILLDWNMPGMNGLEFLQQVKKTIQYQSIPIIMVTTEAEKENVIKALQYGIKNYILKPFTTDELVQKIKQSAKRC
jgi:two-component system, chemotaxis family, chemotaxis protein CheY